MQQAVRFQFPDVEASYRFTNRTLQDTFTRDCFELFEKSVQGGPSLSLLVSSNTVECRIRKVGSIS